MGRSILPVTLTAEPIKAVVFYARGQFSTHVASTGMRGNPKLARRKVQSASGMRDNQSDQSHL